MPHLWHAREREALYQLSSMIDPRTISLMVLALVACDARVAEPESRKPEPREASAPASAGSGNTNNGTHAANSSTQSTDALPPDRCIHPTPAEPARPAPPPGPAADCPKDPEERPELRRAPLRFKEANARIQAEVAEKDPHRLRGLMYSTALGEDEGMLFVFERRSVHRFWMKNTCLPLDMLFVDEDGLIVGIEENVPTLNTRNYQVPCPSLYVIEVNAGWCRRHGVKAGQYVELPER
jgi:uncharacterized membrane protein (UPF0127 family)